MILIDEDSIMQAQRLVSNEYMPEVADSGQNPEERMLWAERRATVGVDATMGCSTPQERTRFIRIVRNALMEIQ